MSDKKNIDKAFNLFQNKKYSEAVSSFEMVLTDSEFPAWMRVRVKQFKAMAERRLAETRKPPEAMLGVSFYMNLNEYDKAEELLGGLDLQKGDKAFLRSEMAIEQGHLEKAVELLKEAIELDERNLGYALNSPSFSEHLPLDEFGFLRSEKDGN